MKGRPVAGDVVGVDGSASVQFGGNRRFRMRVTSVSERPTYHGWAWVTGYVLDQWGNAVERREVYVQLAGLRLLVVAPRPVRRTL